MAHTIDSAAKPTGFQRGPIQDRARKGMIDSIVGLLQCAEERELKIIFQCVHRLLV